MATYVFDRTLEDVKARNEKGTYNATDLNRVQSACDEIAAALTAAGIPVTLSWTRSTWALSYIPTEAEMTEYLENIGKIKAALPNNSPAPPASMAYLTYEGANNIERMLYEVETLLNNMLSVFPRAGVWTSGGVIYIPDYQEPPVQYRTVAAEQTKTMDYGGMEGQISGYCAYISWQITDSAIHALYNDRATLYLTVGGDRQELQAVASATYPKWSGSGAFWIEADDIDYFYVCSATNAGTITFSIEVIDQ